MRRRRVVLRAVPLVVFAVVAFTAGVIVSGKSGDRDAAARFGEAWSRGDYEAMHAELTPAAQGEFGVDELEQAYAEAQRTSTSQGVEVGEARGPLEQDGETVVALPVTIPTTAFGTVDGEIAVPVADGAVAWRPNLVFPGLAEGEELDRKTVLPMRAPILAANRSPLAEGPADARVTSGAGGIVTGGLALPNPSRAKELAAMGYPDGVLTGDSGLELAFNTTLSGKPGGQLFAVGDGEPKVLAESEPAPGEPVRTTIDPDLQDAATSALGATFGGAAVLDAKNGDVLALAGQAFSAPQPPGSTFKIITVTGALQAGITKPSEEFPIASSAFVGGREVSNANDELCGGTLVESFAESCNSVFAPLGEKLGGRKLVETAELFGFNSPPSLYNSEALAAVAPPESTIPPDLADDVAGVSAIGQGEVGATPLEMASAAQTIANNGIRSPTSLMHDPALAGDYPDVEATTPAIADQVKQMMIQVVASGTGIAAALPGVTVAGKTGTAELGTTSGEPVGDAPPEQDVDAWFTAFAPADDPKLVVAVVVFNASGDGGTIAAPIARAILDSVL